MTDRILSRQFHAAVGAEAWRVLPDGAYAFFASDSFPRSVRFVEEIGRLVHDGDHPDIDIRHDGVTVLIRAFKGGVFGLVRADLDLARAISAAARELGLAGDPAAVQSLSIIPGATNRRAIMPFWQVVLGFERRPDSPDEDLVDPHGRLAPFWFEEMDALRPDGAGRSTSSYGCRGTRPSRGSPPPLRLVARSFVTTSKRASGRSPILPATRSMSR